MKIIINFKIIKVIIKYFYIFIKFNYLSLIENF